MTFLLITAACLFATSVALTAYDKEHRDRKR